MFRWLFQLRRRLLRRPLRRLHCTAMPFHRSIWSALAFGRMMACLRRQDRTAKPSSAAVPPSCANPDAVSFDVHGLLWQQWQASSAIAEAMQAYCSHRPRTSAWRPRVIPLAILHSGLRCSAAAALGGRRLSSATGQRHRAWSAAGAFVSRRHCL